jgi:hypothetical protein
MKRDGTKDTKIGTCKLLENNILEMTPEKGAQQKIAFTFEGGILKLADSRNNSWTNFRKKR